MEHMSNIFSTSFGINFAKLTRVWLALISLTAKINSLLFEPPCILRDEIIHRLRKCWLIMQYKCSAFLLYTNLQIAVRIELFVDGTGIIQVSDVQYDVDVIIIQYSHHTSSIPIICYSSTVVDVTRRVYQHLHTHFISILSATCAQL